MNLKTQIGGHKMFKIDGFMMINSEIKSQLYQEKEKAKTGQEEKKAGITKVSVIGDEVSLVGGLSSLETPTNKDRVGVF